MGGARRLHAGVHGRAELCPTPAVAPLPTAPDLPAPERKVLFLGVDLVGANARYPVVAAVLPDRERAELLASRDEGSTELENPRLRHGGSCCCLQQLCTACDAGEGAVIGSEEQVSQSILASIGDPALRQMMRPIVQPVAALEESPQVGEPVVCGITKEMAGFGSPASSLRPHRTNVPSGTQRSRVKCGRPKPWHCPRARLKRTRWLSLLRCRG